MNIIALGCLGRTLPVSQTDQIFALTWQAIRQISHFLWIGYWIDRYVAQRTSQAKNSNKQAALIHYELHQLHVCEYNPRSLDQMVHLTNTLSAVNLMEGKISSLSLFFFFFFFVCVCVCVLKMKIKIKIITSHCHGLKDNGSSLCIYGHPPPTGTPFLLTVHREILYEFVKKRATIMLARRTLSQSMDTSTRWTSLLFEQQMAFMFIRKHPSEKVFFFLFFFFSFFFFLFSFFFSLFFSFFFFSFFFFSFFFFLQQWYVVP